MNNELKLEEVLEWLNLYIDRCENTIKILDYFYVLDDEICRYEGKAQAAKDFIRFLVDKR